MKDEKAEEAEKGKQDKTEAQFTYSEKISCEADWRAMCIERWAWIKEAIAYNSQLCAQ